MRNRIAAYVLAGTLAMSIGIMGCGQQPKQQSQTAPPVGQTTEQVTQTENVIKWIDAKNADEAAKGAKLDKFGTMPSISLVGTEYKDPKYAYADGVAQATYENGAIALIVRKGGNGHTAPLSDRNTTEFANKWTKSYDGIDATMYGATNGSATVIIWSEGGNDYGVTFQGLGGEEVSLNDTEVASVISAMKAANAAQPQAQQNQQNNNQTQNNQAQNQPQSQAQPQAQGQPQTQAQPQNTNQTTNQNQGQTTNNDNLNTGGTASEINTSADQATEIALDSVGGVGSNVTNSGIITGGGIDYYNVEVDANGKHYSVQVDASNGHVVNVTEMENGMAVTRDNEGNRVEPIGLD